MGHVFDPAQAAAGVERTFMDREESERQAVEQAARCRRLATEFPDCRTARNLLKLADEIEQKVRRVEPPPLVPLSKKTALAAAGENNSR